MPSSKNDPDRIPNDQLREAVLRAYERGEITWGSLATDLGLGSVRPRKNRPSSGWHPDTTFLKRMLGISAYKCKRDGSTGYKNKTIQIKYAEAIMRRLGLDPIDVGL